MRAVTKSSDGPSRDGLIPLASLLLAAAIVPLAATPARAQSDRYSVQRTAQVSAAGASSIRIENGSGHLVIRGKAGAGSVSATALIRGSSESEVNAARLITERSGNVITVRVDTPNRGWFNRSWSADLTVEVPADVQLSVQDGSGGVRIDDVGALELTAGSGGARVNNVSGGVDMQTGSGGAHLENIRGDVALSTGSGGITIHGVNGSVHVRRAGSGELDISHVTGSLHLGSIGSGSLTADDIGGDLTVDHKGSGSVEYTNVKGRIQVPSRGRHW